MITKIDNTMIRVDDVAVFFFAAHFPNNKSQQVVGFPRETDPKFANGFAETASSTSHTNHHLPGIRFVSTTPWLCPSADQGLGRVVQIASRSIQLFVQ